MTEGQVVCVSTLGAAGIVILTLSFASVLTVSPLPQATPTSTYAPHAPISIVGDADFTPVNGVTGGTGTAADPYLVENWEIDAGGEVGIEVLRTTVNFTIRHVLVQGAGTAIRFHEVVNGTIDDANATRNRVGVLVSYSRGVTVQRSTIFQNTDHGITIYNSVGVMVRDVRVVEHSQYGIYAQASQELSVAGTYAASNAAGIVLQDVTGAEIKGSNASGNRASGVNFQRTTRIAIVANEFWYDETGVSGSYPFFSRDVELRDNVFGNNRRGLSLSNVNNATVQGNKALGNEYGLALDFMTGTVSANVVTRSLFDGIFLGRSNNVSFLGNRVALSGDSGIALVASRDLFLEGNTLTQNFQGMDVVGVQRATLRRNTITDSTNAGVFVTQVVAYQESRSIQIERNRFERNLKGIHLDHTTDFEIVSNNVSANRDWGIQLVASTGGRIHHNNLDGNALQAFDDSGLGNAWDDGYPSGGNFWSDYPGRDRCSGPNQDVCNDPDGIGDTPRPLDADSVDRYPLISRFDGNLAPVTAFSALPALVIPHEAVRFDASASMDVDGVVVSFSWDFGDGSQGSGVRVNHAYASVGTYTVRLVTLDDGGAESSRSSVVAVSSPGLLRVTTSIDIHPDWGVPARIVVDGKPRDEWGLNWLKIAPGSHVVSFSDVPGLGTPDDVVVDVQSGATREAVGVYRANGWLRVVLDPWVPGTISVNGIRRNDGSLWTSFPPGDYSISFGGVVWYKRPDPQTVRVEAERLTTVVARYVYDGVSSGPDPTTYGLLRVTTVLSDGRIGAPSQISVDGVPRDDWSLTWLKLSPGPYGVSFSDVPGLGTPAPSSVTIQAGRTTELKGTFQVHGTLRVTTNPPVPGTIFVDGIPRDDWGMWQSLPSGPHTVSFGPVPGFARPADDVVLLAPGITSELVGKYIADPQVSVSTDIAYAKGESVEIAIEVRNRADVARLFDVRSCPVTFQVIDTAGRTRYDHALRVACAQVL